MFFFSLKGIFAKFAYAHGVDALSMMGLRMGFSAPVFAAVAWWSGRNAPPIGRADLVRVFVLGFLGYYVASYLNFQGLQYVTASVERLLLFVYPTIVVALSAVFFRKPVTPREVVSLAVTYAGVALVVAGGAAGEQKDIVLGGGLILLCAAFYAIYLVFGSDTIRRVGAQRFTAYGMLAAAVPAVVQWVALRPHEPTSLAPGAYFWSAMLALFATVLPVFLQSNALKRIGANDFSVIGALGPVATILVGHALLAERMTAVQWLGAAAVVGGVLIVSLRPAAGGK